MTVSTLPLAGLRVADFSWVIAGPFATQAMALLGAEVIRIESGVHTDINRRLPPGAEGVLGTERSGLWHGLNLNKKSVTLDLTKPAAQQLAKEIVARCDIAIENFAFGQMEKFNLGYEELKKANQAIIFVTSSGLGRTGPYRSYVTFGPPLTAYTGLASVTGQDGGTPERWIAGVWSDHTSAMTSLFGLLAAVEHRDRTGEGQMVDYSMAEAVAGHLADAFIEYGVTGEAPGPRGNRDLAHCPHGIYRCAGEDRWVAIAVQDDAEWPSLLSLLDGPAWMGDASLGTAAARQQQGEAIDAAITAWTQTRDAPEVAAALQALGISAAPVATTEGLIADGTLRDRGFFLEQDHPEVGRRTLAGMGWDVPAARGQPVRHAPLLGEHNWEVFVEWLGMDPKRFATLVTEGVIA